LLRLSFLFRAKKKMERTSLHFLGGGGTKGVRGARVGRLIRIGIGQTDEIVDRAISLLQLHM